MGAVHHQALSWMDGTTDQRKVKRAVLEMVVTPDTD